MMAPFKTSVRKVLLALLLAAAAIPVAPPRAEAGIFDWIMNHRARRNQADRERILSVLAHQRAIVFIDGRIEVNKSDVLKDYYETLRADGVLNRYTDYANDEHNVKAGQFWRNFFDRKDHTQTYPNPDMDPFRNDNSGLASNIHGQLSSGTHVDYSSTAEDLHSRRIDVLESETRMGVAAGADAMITAMNAVTGGASGQAVKWIEEAVEAGAKINDDKSGALKEHLKAKLDAAIQDTITDKVKAAMGEDRFDSMMENYEKYGDKQQRLKKMMDDLYTRTGDQRFADASKLLDKASTDAIAAQLAAQSAKLLAAAKGEEDKDKDKSKDRDKGKDGPLTDAEKAAAAKSDAEKAATDKAAKERAAKDAAEKEAAAKDKAEKDKSGKDKSVQPPETGDKEAAGKDKSEKVAKAPGEPPSVPPESDAADGQSWQQKAWDDMTDAERRKALLANDPSSWDKFRDLLKRDPLRAAKILNAGKKAKPGPAPDLSKNQAGTAPPAKPSASPEGVRDSLRGLNHDKLKKALASLGIEPPQAFYNCLCASAAYGSSGTAQFYHPDTIGEFNANYSCTQPGLPCVVSGFGCTRHPLPQSGKIWDACMAEHHINTSKTPDGKDDPKSGERMDDYISKRLRARL